MSQTNQNLIRDYHSFLREKGFDPSSPLSRFNQEELDKINQKFKLAKPLRFEQLNYKKNLGSVPFSHLPLNRIFDSNTNFRWAVLEVLTEQIGNQLMFYDSRAYERYQKTFAGYYPSHDINAHAIKRRDNYLCILDDCLISTVFQISNIFIAGFQGYFNEKETVDRIVAIIASHIKGQSSYVDVSSSPGYSLDAMNAFYLFYGTVKYVVGHEYAHIVKGHHEASTSKEISFSSKEGEFKIVKKSWEHEFEADDIGFELLMGYPERDWDYLDNIGGNDMQAINIFAISPFLFFNTLILLHQAQLILIQKKVGQMLISESHPPAEKRIEAIGEKYLKLPRNCQQYVGLNVFIHEVSFKVVDRFERHIQ